MSKGTGPVSSLNAVQPRSRVDYPLWCVSVLRVVLGGGIVQVQGLN